MPVEERVETKVQRMAKGDVLVNWNDSEIHGGKTKLRTRVTVAKVDRKNKYVEVSFDEIDGVVRFELDALVYVMRMVKTEEEKEAEQVRFREDILRRNLNTYIGRPAAMMADFSKKLAEAESPGWIPRDSIDFGMNLCEAVELESLCLQMLKMVIRTENPVSLVDAYEEVREEALRRIVQNAQRPGSRSTSASSNLKEDMENAARAKFADRMDWSF